MYNLLISFWLDRLQKERHVNLEDEEKEKRKLHSDDHSKIKDTVIKATPQGTPVDNMRVELIITIK